MKLSSLSASSYSAIKHNARSHTNAPLHPQAAAKPCAWHKALRPVGMQRLVGPQIGGTIQCRKWTSVESVDTELRSPASQVHFSHRESEDHHDRP